MNYNLLLPDCRESDLFVGGNDTSPSLCHAGEIALLIPGGFLSCTGLTPGSTATVSCEDGYELSEGNGTLVCQEYGTWSGATPTCEKSELCSCWQLGLKLFFLSSSRLWSSCSLLCIHLIHFSISPGSTGGI